LRIEGVAWSAQRIPTAVFSNSYTGTATFSSKQLRSFTHEAEWTPFQTHYFSENLVAPEIEPGPHPLNAVKEIVSVYDENHTEHTDTLCALDVEL
jgi:hypothetical protein